MNLLNNDDPDDLGIFSKKSPISIISPDDTDELVIKIHKIPPKLLEDLDLSDTENLIFKMLPKDINHRLGKRYITFYIADKLNQKYGIDKNIFNSVFYDRTMFNPENLKKHIVKSVTDLSVSKDEVLNFVDNHIKKYNSDNEPKPEGPTDHSWFSNFNEDNILKHMMDWYPKFYAHPSCLSDFMIDYTQDNPKYAEVIASKGMNPGKEPLGILEPKDYTNYNCMGCVVNTDIKPNGGTHWVAIFYDMRDPKSHTLEYFNSTGEPPKKMIKDWMKSFSDLSTRQLGIPCKPITVSNISHQTSNSECGSYSIYFIISRIIGVNYKKFRENKIPDNVVFEFRKCVFRN